jgi:YVTN family beta-propeller protein
LSALTDARIGTELLGYRIEAVLGRGGMSAVYLAHDSRLKRNVALKVLNSELAVDADFRDRFLRESELAASLDHPNVIPIFEAGEADGHLFIAMRYVAGSDLKKLLASGPLEPADAVGLAAQIASALDAAHAGGLAHRDVKPSNVLVAPGAGARGADHVYLSDFGLTQRLGDAERPTAREPLMATIAYVSPEQIRGEQVDDRADVYSFGCLFYECLAGVPPFRASSDAALLFAHLEQEPPRLSERGFPEAIDAVIERALAKDPDERYETVTALVDAARDALGVAAPTTRPWWRAPVRLASVGAVLIAAAAAAYLLFPGGGAPAGQAGVLVRVDPVADKVAQTLSVGSHPTGVAVGAAHVWVTTAGDESLRRIDPKTLGVLRIPANGSPVGLAVKGGVVYVDNGFPSPNVTRIDAQSGQRDDVILPRCLSAGACPTIASGSGGVWLAGVSPPGDATEVVRLSTGPAPGGIVNKVAIPAPAPLDAAHARFDLTAVAVSAGAVWVLGDALDRRLWRVDPRTGRIVATIKLPFAPFGIAAGPGGVWVTAQLGDTVSRVDPATDRITRTIQVGRGASSVALGAGAVWVANAIDGTVSRIDPATERVVATIAVGSSPSGIAVDGGSVWVVGDAS